MTDKVVADKIEQIVGIKRHTTEHRARAVSAEERVYILHSQECKDRYPDLRDCPYSIALDQGIDEDKWVMDQPVAVQIQGGSLVPEDFPND